MKRILFATVMVLSSSIFAAENLPIEFKTIKITAVKEGKVSVNELILYNGDEAVKLKHRKNGKIINAGATYSKTQTKNAFTVT